MDAQSYTLDPRTDLRTIEDVYLVQEDVAAICRVSPGTVRNWRATGKGPRYARLKPPLYRAGDLADWIEANTCG